MANENVDDQEQQKSGSIPSAIVNIMRPAFPGIRNLWRRFGGHQPPRFDPTQHPVWYRPCSRVYSWRGSADGHVTDDPCVLPHCSHPGEDGQHSEVRDDGFDWCGRHFSCLAEALENQAFTDWYEHGLFEGTDVELGKNIMAKGEMLLRPPLYGEMEEPPLPQYNFFLNEHVDEMLPHEILEYKRSGEVPKRFRRRGRQKR